VSAEVQTSWNHGEVSLYAFMWAGHTDITVGSKSRSAIESVFAVFEECPAEDKIVLAAKKAKDLTIFVGHGRSKQWEKLRSHLQDKHDLPVLAYETGARAGHTIRDILDDLGDESSLALLVLTGEDRTAAGGMRARQNVIHECGLFQGRLGFDRAIMLVEQGVELGSNFDGVQQIRFKKGRIAETFGDVIATLRREFGPV
jgi:predicted nucleotide-binding protein